MWRPVGQGLARASKPGGGLVARRRPESTRKKRTREHVIADLSVNHVERFILRCGFSVERVFHDYGLDLYMSTYDSAGEAENGMVLFQLKATDHLKLRADGEALLLRIERTDWIGGSQRPYR